MKQMGVHALIYSAAFSVPAIFGFIGFTALTHLLTPYEYGVYSTGVNFAYFAGSVFFSWIRFSAGRFEAEAKGETATGFWVRWFVITAPFAGFSLWLLVFLGSVSAPVMLCVFALSCCQSLFELFQEIRRARHESRTFALYNLARSALSASMAVVVAYLFRSGLALLMTLALSFGVAAFAGFFRRRREAIEELSRTYSFRTVAAYGASMALSGMVFSSAGVFSRLIVAHFSGLAESGPFNASLDLAGQVGSIVAMSVYSVIGPSIIRSYANGDRKGVISQFEYGGELLLAVVAPTTVGMMLVSRPLASLLTGQAYHDAVSQLLPLAILGTAIWNCNHYYIHIAFQITSKPMLQVLYGVVQLVLVAVLTVVLVPFQGPSGGAWAFLISNAFTLVLSFSLARTVFPIPIPIAGGPKVGLSVLAMTLAVDMAMGKVGSPVGQLAAAVPTGVIVYVVCAIVMNICGSRAYLLGRIKAVRMTPA
jgi:O-antigen/teichoic acid export membrane protein